VIIFLIAVRETTHSTHNSEDVVVGSIDANLGSLGSLNCGVGKNKLESGVVNAGEVACARGLVFLGAKGKGVHVDALVGVAGVGLVRLNPREVGSFTLREAILAVELELGGDDGVLAPAVKVEGSLGEYKGAGIGNCGARVVVGEICGSGLTGDAVAILRRRACGVRSVGVCWVGVVPCENLGAAKVGLKVGVGGAVPVAREVSGDVCIKGTGILEETTSINVGIGVGRNLLRTAKGMNGVGKSVNGIGVVKGLGTKNLEEGGIASEGRAVVDVLIGLNNPDKLLHGVVEVELDLVAGRTNGLVTSELELGDEVLVGVLGHTSALISVKEHVVNVEGSSYDGLVVRNGGGHRATSGILVSSINRRTRVAGKSGDSPQALINGTNVKVDLHLVVLEGNEGKGKTGVGAEPELEGHVEGCLGKSVTRSTNLAGSKRVTRAVNVRERGVSDEGKLGGVPNHLEIAALLLRSHGELVPDMHPVTILAIDALATNLNFNLSDELFAGEI